MQKPKPESKKEIQFKPLSDGLGFHPFSDGLPYAPISRSASASIAKPRPQAAILAEMGTGAVSAGPAVPVTSRTQAAAAQARAAAGASQAPGYGPSTSRPASYGTGATAAGPATFARTAPRISVPVANAQAAPLPSHVTPKMLTSPIAAAEAAYPFGFVYLIKRAISYVLDSTINMALCCAALATVMSRQDPTFSALLNPWTLALCGLFLFAFNWAVIAAQETLFGTSLIKRLFGLELKGTTGQIFWRAVFFLPSVLLCGIGVLWSVVDGRKRCWHDHVMDLQPIEVARI